ncbi:serine/threonine-protein kinase SMG1-like isoform X1 [Haliotis rufescens]|uniref:serine/threonine-protein kinase SMG1-like isoform X1 n=1 Tax=Haliotis rufescens TaxID=6454 RepID=UPI00201EF537|nr:serine/threonine-protein kinase SMG1-like isoform X1 [Haliotis rufescens]
MSDKSGGVKQKSQENLDKNHDKSANGSGENSRSNLSESGSPEKVSTASKYDPKARSFDRKTSPRPPPKGRGVYKNGGPKPRREDERNFNSNAKGFRRYDTKSGAPPPPQTTSSLSEKKTIEPGKTFTDESRLSKVMRRLLRDADRDRRLTAAKQLKDYLHTVEGGKAAVKSADDLLAALPGIFFERGYREVKVEVALSIGAIGSAVGQDMQSFFQWLFGQTETVFEDEVKTFYLLALLETLRCDEKRQNAAELMQLVMEKIQTLLENADTPELLTAVVDVIMFIAKIYPHIFSMHFRDTVDILVGWHIDATQKEALIRYTSQALVSFHMFWTSDLSFSLTLLGQFLEDMEAYAEDLNLNMTVQPLADEDLPPAEECITKISALLRVFTTVIQSLGDSFSPTKGGQISREYVYEVLDKIVRSVENATKNLHSESIFIAANVCLTCIASQLQNNITPTCEGMLPFITRQIFLTKLLSKHHLMTLFDLVHKVVEVFGPQLPVIFLTKVLGPGSLLHGCVMSHSGEVLGHLMSVYHAILGLKSVPLLEESYRLIRSSVEACYTKLLAGGPSHAMFESQEENPFSHHAFSIRQAEAIILFDVCALAEIGNTKSNLIGMWALSPSVFDLLSTHLCPVEPWIAECYPSVQFAVVYALYSHCCRHSNFTSSSSMLSQPSPVDSAIISSVSMVTSGHFAKVLELTEQLLAHSKTTYDVRCLVIKWVSEIITSLHTSQHIFLKAIFIRLLKTLIGQGFNTEQPIFMAVNQCLMNLFKSTVQFPKEVVKLCVELCAFRLTDLRRQVKEAFNSLLKILPLDVVTSNLVFEAEEEALASQRRDRVVGLKAAWLARRNHIGKQPMGTFHSHNFRHVMAYLLNNMQPSQQGVLHWLEAMYHSSQRSDKEQEKTADVVTLADLIDGNESLLWFWATWEAANFCVLARLRTPLGKPQETFMTIESVLKSIATEVSREDTEDGGAADAPKSERPGEYTSLLRVHLLLQFMEHLEKLLYNAYEGCAVAMPTPPKTVRTFFRTNRNTCQEWIARIRVCIIKMAVHAGMSAAAARHAYELLKDMVDADNTNVPEFEQGVVYLTQALCDLRSPECVMGVYNWCRDVAGRKFSWIKAVAEKAERRYEAAAREFKSMLKNTMSVESDDDSKGRSSSSSPEGSPRPGSENKPLHKMILSKQPEKNPGTVNFMVNEVMDCYIQLSDWDAVLEWQESVQKYRSENTLSTVQTAFNSNYDINYIKALSHFDSGNLSGVRESLELVPGASLSEMSKSEAGGLTWNPRTELENIHSQFIKAATLLQEHKQTNHRTDIQKCLSQAERCGEGLLRIKAMDWPPTLSGQVLNELNTVSMLRKQLDEKRVKTSLLSLSEQLLVEPDSQELGTYMQTLRLLNLQLLLPGCDRKPELKNQLSRTLLAASSLSRKQHSYELAEDLLVRQVITLMRNSNENGRITFPNDLVPALASLRSCNGSLNQMEVMKVERESAKLLHSISQPKDAIEVMSSSIMGNILLGDTAQKKPVVGSCAELCSRSLVTLVKWMQGDQKLLGSVAAQVKLSGQGDGSGTSSHTVRNIKLLMEMEEKGAKKRLGLSLAMEDQEQVLKIGDNPILSDSDSIIGRLLHLCAMESPKLAKSWFTLAGWCYKWGRKAVDNASHGSVELSTEEKGQILSIIPKGTSSEETERVLGVLSQIHSPLSSEEDISDQDQSLYDDGTETTRKQLLATSTSLQMASEECIEQLLAVWQGVVQRVYHYYKLSAKAYFTYLHLNGVNEETDNADCNIISTLRLLRLLVKHAWELRNVLESGLAQTPTTPWKGIIPQLFSRLSHPEGYVRQSVSDLLCRVAQDAPHLIIYPAVVGSSANKMEAKVTDQRGLLSNYLSEEEESLDPDEGGQGSQGEDEGEDPVMEDPSATMLQTCLATIVDTLSHHNPKMISEVQQMVQELRRVTLLWDELWLGTLNQQHTDVVRSLAQLESEVKKVNANQSLNKEEKTAIIREKHKTIMKPILYTMERLHEITSQAAETPHEKWFQDTYGELIENALQRLRNPSNPSNPAVNWQLFKQLHVSLQQRAQKRNSLQLRMEEISPRLSSLVSSVIPMPGLGVLGQTVTIESVYNTAQILPTKTKPKKLVLLGSDGRRYPYLFKGLEDLHLDERIMQFLSIVNNMFSKSNKGTRQLYRARHYSVTPLGPRSGLIQWVEGATPLFGLYKKWQQREAIAQTLKISSSGQSSASSNAATILRPSDIYYNKLTPALKDKGIDNLDSRKEWPLSVLRNVLEELMEETPKDLLARELWCASSGPNEWWQITQTYARSTAVMSMIGYIIGLGDRHLDNVLVDLATGEVVHIDYNVCFEKGKGLRVPERVPFRMTQNIETALGVTGIEGTFRTASEHVMKTMRKGRETLLTLLEAFVYDPLVDWTTGNEGGYTGAFYGGGMTTAAGAGEKKKSKKEMEREITCSMFAIRVMEMKAAWTKNREDIMTAVPELREVELSWIQMCERHLSHLTDMDGMKEVKQLLMEAQRDAGHALYSLQERYAEYSVVKAAKDSAYKAVEEKINEFSHWQKMHKHCLETMQGSVFQKMCSEVAKPLDLGAPSFSAATEFLQGAGQSQIVGQCEQLETEMSGHLQQRRSLLHSVFEVLHSYSTIVSQFGAIFADEARTSHYLWWLQELVCDFTTNKCEQITSRYHDLFGPGSTAPSSKTQVVMTTETRLQSIDTETNAKIRKLLDRRSQELVDTPILEIQYHESERAIQAFVQDSGMCGVTSLICVIVSALCSLNKRYIMMEGAASGAGDRLMDLTSRDGDWFLDELSSMSGNVNMFLDTLKNNTMAGDVENFRELHHALTSTHNAYVALQDLNINFRTIILPETLKLIQAQDASLLSLLSHLENMISDLKQPLDALVAQLEVLHRNAVMGIENDSMECMTIVRNMQCDFNKLLQGSDHDSGDLTPGQMLLMGFNGLFTRLENEFASMLEAIDSVQVPDVWRKVDVVKEAKSMQLSSFTSSTRGLLSNLFFLKRLQAMQDFFHMGTQFAAALQGLDGGVCYDDEQMAKPIKKFIADYVRKQVIGFPSQILGYIICVFVDTLGVNVTAEIELKDVGAESKVPLDDLCKKAVDQCLRNSQFQHVHLTQATSLTGSQDSSWRKHDLARRLDNNISLVKTSLQRCQPQVARFQWLHEDLFSQAGRHPTQFDLPVRANVMSEMRKGMQSLLSQEGVIAGCEDRYSQLEGSITQRLRWAAGANPTLNFVLQQFEEASNRRKMSLETESKMVTEVVSLCQGILHFEALRTRTAEAVSSDTNFLTHINRCNEVCMLMESSSSSVSDLEVQLMTTRSPEEGEKITAQWLESTLDQVNKDVAEMDTQTDTIKAEIDGFKISIQDKVSTIKTVLASHHKLMSDLRSILKSMAKQEEQDYGDYVIEGGIREYLATYKNFSENMAAALKTAVSDDMTKEGMQEARVMLADLLEQIPQIYDTLLQFAPPILPDTEEEEEENPTSKENNQALKKPAEREVASPARRMSTIQRELQPNTPPFSPQAGAAARAQSTPIVKKERVIRDPRTGKAIQERNTYAVGVWRRVKMKLDGRDPDPNKRMSVAEQVDYVLKEATHLDNLAVLYEGWTPWV